MWSDYDEEAEKAALEVAPTDGNIAPLKSEYLDVIISDVRTENFGFSVQILNTEGKFLLHDLAKSANIILHWQASRPLRN